MGKYRKIAEWVMPSLAGEFARLSAETVLGEELRGGLDDLLLALRPRAGGAEGRGTSASIASWPGGRRRRNHAS